MLNKHIRALLYSHSGLALIFYEGLIAVLMLVRQGRLGQKSDVWILAQAGSGAESVLADQSTRGIMVRTAETPRKILHR